ncbi:type II 3-dehydroquinate dehydratase [Salipaludibacillus daqingensis]|uniref:type II 3-dehydroquinate dehydratase n=1 Tax=Salipaludibacillus daqingensis TaxID=3041001 RepID=UPI0024755DEE|nr:type II 3-dehydroquinate dehydratase [Salipaludibacillus daqingensis]
MKILILNGPNLNRLGQREPDIYGSETLTDLVKKLESYSEKNNVTIQSKQSNWEGQLIDWLHEADNAVDGVVFNPGAFTHYSYAIRDAIASIDVPVVEVHISHVHAREEFRKTSVVAPVCIGQISGFGFTGYEMAIDYFWRRNRS